MSRRIVKSPRQGDGLGSQRGTVATGTWAVSWPWFRLTLTFRTNGTYAKAFVVGDAVDRLAPDGAEPGAALATAPHSDNTALDNTSAVNHTLFNVMGGTSINIGHSGGSRIEHIST